MNNWNFTGNLGHSAEQKFITSGESVVEFSVAVKSGFGAKASTTWAKCAMWGKRGEAVLQYLKKGQLVGVSGEVTLRQYVKKDGTSGASLEVRVNDLTLLGKNEVAQDDESSASPSTDIDDDIPF